jgi:hypothetical protein
MDTLHQMAHPKSPKTSTPVCGMSGYKFHDPPTTPIMTIGGSNDTNAVTFFSAGVEVLKCSHKGFWVRGKKIKQDDREAEAVYNSFKEWLTWQQLNRE